MERRELERDKNYVVVEYEFSKDEIAKAEERAYRYLNRRLDIPGFRRGRIPKSVLKMRLGKTYYEYVLDELAEDAFRSEELVKISLLLPEILERKVEGEKALLKIEYHLEPEVKLPEMEGIVLEKVEKDRIVQKYVDERLEDLRQEHALVEPKEGKAEYGDMVRVRMVVTTDGKTIRDEEYEYVLVEGDDRPFVTDIVGKERGDVVEFDREYKGRTYHYRMEILEVFSRTLMELDDEFARTVSGEFETLDQLKNHLFQEGEKLYDMNVEKSLRDQALNWLMENSELIISTKTLDRMVETAIEKLKEDGKYDSYVEEYGGEEKLLESLREYYKNKLLEEYAIKVYAERNGIEVTDEDLEKEAESIAQLWGISVPRAKTLVKNNEKIREEVEWTLLKNKVADSIISKAEIKEVKLEEEESEEEDRSE